MESQEPIRHEKDNFYRCDGCHAWSHCCVQDVSNRWLCVHCLNKHLLEQLVKMGMKFLECSKKLNQAKDKITELQKQIKELSPNKSEGSQ